MSLVSKEALDQIKDDFSRAKGGNSFELGYYASMRALQTAIGLLEQIDHSTQGYSFEIKPKES